MSHSLLVLASLTCLPAQQGGLPFSLGYTSEQKELARCEQASYLNKQTLQQETLKGVYQTKAVRDSNGSLLSRLLIMRQVVQKTDRACWTAALIAQRYDAEYLCTPAPITRGQFYCRHNSIYRQRATVRMGFYMEFLYHKWSWETWERGGINYHSINTLSSLLGYEGHYDDFLLHVGWVDAFLTEASPFIRW